MTPYALATSTALARMEERRHYLADVLCGAAIGMVIGYEIVNHDAMRALPIHLTLGPQRLGFSLRF